MKATITKAKFLQWYFLTGDDQWKRDNLHSLGEGIMCRLLAYPNSVFSIDAHEIFEESCIDSIPLGLLEEFPNDDNREIYELEEEIKLELI